MEQVKVEGMTCSNCALKVTDKLREVGLENVVVEHATGDVQFENTADVDDDRIAKELKRMGYTFKREAGASKLPFGWNPLQLQFAISILLTLPLWVMMLVDWHVLHNPWFQFALTTPVFAIGIHYFGRSAFNAVKSGTTNMDVLVILGTGAAYIYSVIMWVTQTQPELYFETTASIITIVLGGNLLESWAVNRAGQSLKDLQELQPETAHVISGQGEKETVHDLPAKNLLAGDRIRVKPGERIPADGEIISGELQCDESLLTGESEAVRHSAGERVISGATIINGSADIKVTAAGKQSTIANIIDRVHKARADKPDVQKLADKISAWFVPLVVAIAIATFFISLFALDIGLQASVIRAVAVLVVACPCALGLATPTSVAVGIGLGAQNGIIIRKAQAMQQWLRAEVVILDKTGTLTTAEPALAEIDYQSDNQAHVDSVLRSLEARSGHPVAKAVVRHLSDAPTRAVSDLQEKAGEGVYGSIDGQQYFVGKHSEHAHYDSVLLQDGQLLAGLRFKEALHPAATDFIAALRKANKRPIIASGDREAKVRAIAEALGIQEFHAGVQPEEKQALVNELQSQGQTVAMVGDGVNDAPALAQADVSVSLNNGLKVAADAADIVLLPADLKKMSPLARLSKLTVNNIKQNLGWVFLYNGLAIPFAAAGFLSPMIAAALMAGSDIVVILNALRLRLRF